MSTRESRSHWFGSQSEEHQRDDRGEDLPAPAPGVVALQQAPAEQADRGEDRQDRGGEHRVAGEDREPAAGEEREGAEGEDGGGDAEGGAAAEEGQAERDAAGGADHPRPLQHLAEPARAVEDEVDRAGLAFQRLDRFFGAGPGVGGLPAVIQSKRAQRSGPARASRTRVRGGAREGTPRSDKCRPN